jgi:dGTPase
VNEVPMSSHPRGELAAYAMRVEDSRGRRYPEPVHPYRNDYERDRDRIVHARAFRRLENKTQVFTRRVSDHFRNRLTHTLEVAQTARTVAEELGLSGSLVEALALVHDVGHPPFGHAGEKVLAELMAVHHDTFDHNLHALRIVEKFEQKYIDFPGLNLTFEVREGIIKHSHDYNAALHPDLVEYGLAEFPPLEAQLIDLADEIAYSCADLDDGREARLLTVEQIRAGVPLFESLFQPIDREHPQAAEKLKFNEALKHLMDVLVTDLIEATRKRLEEAGVQSVEDVRTHGKRLVGFSLERGRQKRELKEFLHANLYAHQAIGGERKRIARCLENLFVHYLEHPRSLPVFYQQQAKVEPAHRVVCDYIAGMTDNYLMAQYQKIAGE